MRRLEWISEALDRLIFDEPSMPLCARAHWHRHKFWPGIWVRVMDVLFRWKEPNHCQRCYGRRWP